MIGPGSDKNEKRVAANQIYFLKEFSILKSSLLAEHILLNLVTDNGEEQLKKHIVQQGVP